MNGVTGITRVDLPPVGHMFLSRRHRSPHAPATAACGVVDDDGGDGSAGAVSIDDYTAPPFT